MPLSRNLLVPEILDLLRENGVDVTRTPVVVGGVIPDDDAEKLRSLGIARVFTPKEQNLTAMVGEIADLLGRAG